jgi:hypothetical protein
VLCNHLKGGIFEDFGDFKAFYFWRDFRMDQYGYVQLYIDGL